MSPSVVPVRRSGSIAQRNAKSRAVGAMRNGSRPISSSWPGNTVAMAIARSLDCCARRAGRSTTSGSSVSGDARGSKSPASSSSAAGFGWPTDHASGYGHSTATMFGRLQLVSTPYLVAVCPCMVLVPGPHFLNGAIDLARMIRLRPIPCRRRRCLLNAQRLVGTSKDCEPRVPIRNNALQQDAGREQRGLSRA
jgi:hypothetical protein